MGTGIGVDQGGRRRRRKRRRIAEQGRPRGSGSLLVLQRMLETASALATPFPCVLTSVPSIAHYAFSPRKPLWRPSPPTWEPGPLSREDPVSEGRHTRPGVLWSRVCLKVDILHLLHIQTSPSTLLPYSTTQLVHHYTTSSSRLYHHTYSNYLLTAIRLLLTVQNTNPSLCQSG